MLERALRVASGGPRGSLYRDGDAVYVAVEPARVLRVEQGEAASALEAFARAVDGQRENPALGQSIPRAFGWLSYDAMRSDDPARDGDARPCIDAAPAAHLAFYEAALRADCATGAALFEGEPAAVANLRRAWESANEPLAPVRRFGRVRASLDEEAHRRGVGRLRGQIRDGEVYLVNYASALHAEGDREQLASRVLRSRAARAGYFDAGDVCVAGMSMELALAWERATGELRTSPIKGTRPRGATTERDEANARELAADPKERAENVMAVDVHRNDLGRVAARGSVTVDALWSVEAHAFVHHLVSTVRARVRDGATTEEVLRAVMPVGSVTGAPKRAAMECIARLEAERRGVYTGAYGCAWGDGSLSLAVAIRTAVRDAGGVHYGVGGGIVAASEPSREWRELQWKSRGFIGA